MRELIKMENKNTLKFITIEGVDGAGKSTYIPFIKNYLESKGEKVILTREPGGTDLGNRLRDLLLTVDMDLLAETLLMFAARSQHVSEVINPALESGAWVICDRFTDSTLAYQCSAKGLPDKIVKTLERLVQGDVRPGLTFVFDVPVEVSRQRLNKTKKVPDKFERQGDEFFQSVILGYKDIVKMDPNRCKLIDSSKTIDETNDQVLLHLEEFHKKLSLVKNRQFKMS